MAFEQTFKNIDNVLYTDDGCNGELDYIEQKSWILFLKYLDDLDENRKITCELQDKPYTSILDKGYRWGDWAMPRNKKPFYCIPDLLQTISDQV
ncbi:MAG: hypothetical protein IKI67_03610 [Bacteroidales bacterium]|nr:hypothetical protein [Bacteroidales bacterium]